MLDKKAIKRNYKENPPMIGVYLIQNKINGKFLIGGSENIPGIFNRIKFELKLKTHRNKQFLADWLEFGEDNFSFEIIDTIEPNNEFAYNYGEDLAVLIDLCMEKIRQDSQRLSLTEDYEGYH